MGHHDECAPIFGADIYHEAGGREAKTDADFAERIRLVTDSWESSLAHPGFAIAAYGFVMQLHDDVGSQLAPLDGLDDAWTSSAKTIGNLHDATEPRYLVERWRVRRGPSETGGRPNPERPCRQPKMASDLACPVATR
jgi:hypothetical protein